MRKLKPRQNKYIVQGHSMNLPAEPRLILTNCNPASMMDLDYS